MATLRVIRACFRIPSLYVSYGLSQASMTSVDYLILLFAAKVLYAPQQDIGFLDAVGTMAYTLASIGFGFLWQRSARGIRFLAAAGLFSLGIPIFLFSSIGTLWMAYTLTTILSALMVLPGAFTVSYISESYPRSQWASSYGKLGASGSLGGALGLLISVGWLALASRFDLSGLGERTLFMAMGLVTVLSAAGIWHTTFGTFVGRRQPSAPERPAPYKSPDNTISTLWAWLGGRSSPKAQTNVRPLTEPAMSDALRKYLFLTALLHMGVGMSFTGTMLYMIGDLKTSASIVLLTVLVFRIAAYLVSSPTGNHLNQLMPLRFQQIAVFWRFLAVAILGLVTLMSVGPWSLIAIIPLVAVYGITSGIMGVTGPVAASIMVATSKQLQSFLLFVALSNGGAGTGAWLASIAAQTLGFPALFGVSALIIGSVLLLWHKL